MARSLIRAAFASSFDGIFLSTLFSRSNRSSLYCCCKSSQSWTISFYTSSRRLDSLPTYVNETAPTERRASSPHVRWSVATAEAASHLTRLIASSPRWLSYPWPFVTRWLVFSTGHLNLPAVAQCEFARRRFHARENPTASVDRAGPLLTSSNLRAEIERPLVYCCMAAGRLPRVRDPNPSTVAGDRVNGKHWSPYSR